jgi:hypothetical protein
MRFVVALVVCTVVLVTGCADVAEVAPAQCRSGGGGVPELVVELWVCELLAAGVPADAAVELALDAVVLSHCESAWNPAVVAFAGRYRDVPRPLDGRIYTQAGVFQLTREQADRHVPGGYAAALDPQANIVGAARLFAARYPEGRLAAFSGWGCAPLVLPGFADGPAALPSWAELYRPR